MPIPAIAVLVDCRVGGKCEIVQHAGHEIVGTPNIRIDVEGEMDVL